MVSRKDVVTVIQAINNSEYELGRRDFSDGAYRSVKTDNPREGLVNHIMESIPEEEEKDESD